ncbi:MAG: ABC transporter permease [Thermodesulfobacteriota bacterium]|nr:ABC transporter permease [Thermodesulfobacteriota bacterium]
MLLFGVQLKCLPVCGDQTISQAGLFGALKYLILPSLTLGIMQSGLIARMVRSAMLDILNQDYIRTARSKGLGAIPIIFHHGLRNAMIPTVTVVPLS